MVPTQEEIRIVNVISYHLLLPTNIRRLGGHSNCQNDPWSTEHLHVRSDWTKAPLITAHLRAIPVIYKFPQDLGHSPYHISHALRNLFCMSTYLPFCAYSKGELL